MYLQGINFAPVAAWLGEVGLWLFGAWDESLKVLCVLVIIDYFTGFAKGVVLGNVSRRIGWRGIFKKALLFIAIIVSHLFDKILFEGASVLIANDTPFGIFNESGMIRNITIWFYAANEALSIIENLQQSGVKIPKFIERILRDLEERLNDKGEERDN